MSDANRVLRYDRSELPEKAEITAEGFLRADAVFTRVGIFQYTNADGSVRRELRHPDDVFAPEAVASFKLVPITNDHPTPRADGLQLVDAETFRRVAIGYTGENVRAEGTLLRGPVVITDAHGVATVRAGRRFLSGGYTARLEPGPGIYDGQQWDYRQRDIRGNHIAVVDAPRAGEVAQIRLDGNQEFSVIQHQEDSMNDPKFATVILDGITYQAAPEVAVALQKAREESGALKARLDKAEADQKAGLDRLRAERDALKDRCDKAEKRDIRADVKARVGLETVARGILPETDHERLDSMSDAEIRRAVIMTTWPELKLDGLSEEYVRARFEIALEEQQGKIRNGDTRIDALAKQREKVAPRHDGTTHFDEAMKRAANRIANQWRPDWKPAV